MICKYFAIKSAQDKKFEDWFQVNEIKKNTKTRKSKFKKIHTRTKRFQTSSIPYF